MGISNVLVEYDQLSVKIFTTLSTNALDNISESAGQMLDVACLFFDKDVSKAIIDFQKLYLEHSNLDDIKGAINEEVDDIFERAQQNDLSSSEESTSLLEGHTIDELANIQKDLEALIQQDDHIKQRMVPVMQCMQYEDIIINRIQRLVSCWEHMINLLNTNDDVDIPEELANFVAYLSTEDEHEKFYSLVIEKDYKDSLNTKDHDIKKIEHNISSVSILQERFFKFSQSSLNECISQTQNAFEELIDLLNLVTGESETVGYLFSGSSESFADIKAILKKHRSGECKQTKSMITEIAETKAQHSKEADSLIGKFMMALQSQDRIRQNIENMGNFHHYWLNYRETVKRNDLFSEPQQQEFGTEAMKLMTSEAERNVIHAQMPGLVVSDSAPEDDDIFF